MLPPSLPPKPKKTTWLSPTQVSRYVEDNYGFKPTRQTVNNWIKKGRNGHTLAAKATLNGHKVDKEDVDVFVKTFVL